jgi:hypothetical protein
MMESRAFIVDSIVGVLATVTMDVVVMIALWLGIAGVFLVTQNFPGSEFIRQKELPVLLEKAKNRGCVIFWIAVSSSTVADSDLSPFEGANDPNQPLDKRAGIRDVSTPLDVTGTGHRPVATVLRERGGARSVDRD